jgi:hypothetical protein
MAPYRLSFDRMQKNAQKAETAVNRLKMRKDINIIGAIDNA